MVGQERDAIAVYLQRLFCCESTERATIQQASKLQKEERGRESCWEVTVLLHVWGNQGWKCSGAIVGGKEGTAARDNFKEWMVFGN